MEGFLIGLCVVNICLAILAGYAVMVDNFFEKE